MSIKTQTAEKRTAVEYLEFNTRTIKRVTWESWEFTVVGPYHVRVTNASYGYLKDDHSYTVGVEERDGVVVPAECECPADVHREPDCKHKLALATVAGPSVLNAAVAFENPAPDTDAAVTVTTGADLLTTDGGVLAEAKPDDRQECPECAKLSDLPCWPCYQEEA